MEQREGVVGGPSAEVDRASLLTMLTTEHFTLQGARASTISESAARAARCVGMVSSALIALGFLGHASEFGAVFDAFALEHDRSLLFPTTSNEPTVHDARVS